VRGRENKPEDPKVALVKGLGLLWRAARSAASGIKKEVEDTDWGKTIDDAGREVVRATSNVVNRIGSELRKVGGAPETGDGRDEQTPGGAHRADDNASTPKDKPKGPTPEDPGFTIADRDRDDRTPR
jgi:hypothetical protein